ncbi:MAG: family 16 glycosylhydrolase [Gammaproteobacteria bacterium]
MAAISLSILSACSSLHSHTDSVQAINIGGARYVASYGTVYTPEQHVQGGRSGFIDKVKGSSDSLLFQSYREGDVSIELPVDNQKYDVTFYFAEPREIEGGERVFDVFAENELVIDDIDVMAFRDGKTISALTVTVPNILVTDGELSIDFAASAGQPVISAVSVAQTMPRSDDWKLAWSDEFDGPELDANKWSPDIWKAGHVNDENQTYTPRKKNLRVENGNLVIEAHKEDYNDANYTSGRIHSQGKADFLYGRFDVRAKLPKGQGTWPAIWMLASNPFTYATKCTSETEWQGNPDCDAWPNSGEIDILEHVGYQMNHVHGTVHTKAYYWVNWEQRKGRILLDKVDEKFHVYSMEWSPERIDMYVDDSLYFTYVNEGKGWEHWPFDHPFHLIMNVAVGGYWGRAGGPIDDSIFPQRMLVDYARVYSKAD